MAEMLVWILIATGGVSSGSSFMQPIYFKEVSQCEHVAKNIGVMFPVNTPRCIQARILVPIQPAPKEAP
ncbi:hypothetical protein HNP33_004228 [Comamonas odontotermitis]|uniref:Secreted protein n=1 Tax=Comamonas odontotermitis TaxID=379895 RepID=A0ABR6RLZ7_9BURK|nr:hypothetical protein [Comamonas odontotermitis]MBB6580097.1 hypothetical protein [Comamonas odontotermitis]